MCPPWIHVMENATSSRPLQGNQPGNILEPPDYRGQTPSRSFLSSSEREHMEDKQD